MGPLLPVAAHSRPQSGACFASDARASREPGGPSQIIRSTSEGGAFPHTPIDNKAVAPVADGAARRPSVQRHVPIVRIVAG